MSQNGRVLALLRARGARGVTVVDFDPGPGGQVADGGPRFTRLAARIKDLRDQGHTIVKTGETAQGFARYVLAHVREDRPHLEIDGWAWCRRHVCVYCHASDHKLIGPVCDCGRPAPLMWDCHAHVGGLPPFITSRNEERSAA